MKTYTPSTLLQPGQWELKIFNNLYSQTAFFNENNERIEESSRSSFFTTFFQFLWGHSNTLNVGVDLYYKGVSIDPGQGSPFKILNFQDDSLTRRTFSHFGPKIKIAPFPQKAQGFSIQSSFMVPLDDDLDGSDEPTEPFLDNDSFVWWTQFFYDLPVNDWLQLFFEGDAIVNIKKKASSGNGTFVENPYSAFVNFYPTDKWTVYSNGQFAITYGEGFASSYYFQTGIGMKYQIIEGLEAEILYTNFVAGHSSGAGQTFNLGLRVVNL